MQKTKNKKDKIREKTKTFEITITKKFVPTRTQKKLINFLHKIIINSKLKKHYNFTFSTQKYTLKFILTHIICFLHEYKCWRNLGCVWNNIYKHYLKLNKHGFLENSYKLLLQKYLRRTKNKTLKFTSCDATILINKNGIDCKGRNKYAKNKFCTKLFTIIDKNKIPIVMFYIAGNTNDIKCLNISLEKFLEQYNKNICYFLADTGFHSKFISELLQKYKVKYLIPKNMRNSKKYKKKNRKLSHNEKFRIQFEEFTKRDKQIYKKRIAVENMYANYKNSNKRFNIREDKYIKNLEGFTYLFFSEKILNNIK